MAKYCFSCAILVVAAIIAAVSMRPAYGQITTACTISLINSFTPCVNYLTGSSNGGSSPTAECCDSLGSLVSSGSECTCLILTGNVPFGLPINRTLAITLPRMCNSASVPLQCKATATPLPRPGPVTYAPSLPPLSSTGSEAESPSISPSPSSLTISASPPLISQGPAHQRMRPVVIPNSGVNKPTHMYQHCLIPLVALGTMLLNKF